MLHKNVLILSVLLVFMLQSVSNASSEYPENRYNNQYRLTFTELSLPALNSENTAWENKIIFRLLWNKSSSCPPIKTEVPDRSGIVFSTVLLKAGFSVKDFNIAGYQDRKTREGQ